MLFTLFVSGFNTVIVNVLICYIKQIVRKSNQKQISNWNRLSHLLDKDYEPTLYIDGIEIV